MHSWAPKHHHRTASRTKYSIMHGDAYFETHHRALTCWQSPNDSIQISWETPRLWLRRAVPLASKQPRFFKCVLQLTTMLPPCCYLTQAGRAAACKGLLICWQSRDILHTFPLGLWGAAGWVVQLVGMTAGCYSQPLTDISKRRRQAGMATIIEQSAAVVPLFFPLFF